MIFSNDELHIVLKRRHLETKFQYPIEHLCSIIEKNRMLADFCIARLSKDMKIVGQKNHLGGQILYIIPDPLKKWRLTPILNKISSYPKFGPRRGKRCI